MTAPQSIASGGSTGNPPAPQSASAAVPLEQFAASQIRFGWWMLFVFLTMGIALEGFHAFKLQYYLNKAHETRKLMFTLAHAHGTLLGLVNVAWGLSLWFLKPRGQWAGIARCLFWATLLMPGGFFLGGLVIHTGEPEVAADPGIGILLLPVGAVLLLIAIFRTARNLGGNNSAVESPLQKRT